ncbi:MAG: AsmA family protein, partial [Burkholderiales bacterium]|nr:AsmA family protein [Burkholderiales bacterium]
MTRGRAIAAVVIALLVTLVLVFDWNWFREPLQNYVTRKTDREFRISDLDVRLGFTPTILLKDVYFANPPWAEGDAMAQVGAVDVSVSLRSLLAGEIYVPRLALTDADVRLEQMVDDRKNWTLSDRDDPSSTKVRIGSISVTRGNLRFVDHGMPLQLKVAVDTVDPTTPQKAVDGSVRPDSQRLTTRFVFDGKYHDAKFSGNALTGDVVSFQQTGVLFPIRGHLKAGTTTLDVDGTVADVTDISAIDVHLRIAGQTLANLYPFLLLPLPASPPYRLEGNLKLSGNRFAMDKIRGKIGETDVSGSGSYVRQEPRPLLEAKLHSQLLNIADLGPLVGVTTKSSTTTAPATQAETATEDRAKAKERASSGDRVLPAGTPPGERLLPTGKFEGGRLKAIDAKADFSVDKVKVPGYVDVNDLRVGLRLKDGVLKLDPFDATVAGGKLVSKITLDATGKTLLADIDVEARRFKLGALLPSSDR